MKVGDTVRAIPGGISSIWAEGQTGVIAEIAHKDDPYSRNLVRWNNGAKILMGFNPHDVEVVSGNSN